MYAVSSKIVFQANNNRGSNKSNKQDIDRKCFLTSELEIWFVVHFLPFHYQRIRTPCKKEEIRLE